MIDSVAVLAALCIASASPQSASPDTGYITGTVRNALGEPLAALQVTITCGRDPEIVARSLTDGDGMFAVHKLPLDREWFTLHAKVPGRTDAAAQASLSATRRSAHVEMRMWDAASVRVTVVDPDGAPVPGALVTGSYDVSRLFGLDPCAEAESGDDGTATLVAVPLGLIEVRAWHPGYVLAEERRWLDADTDVAVKLVPGNGTRLAFHVDALPKDREATVQVWPSGNGRIRTLPRALTHGVTQGGDWSCDGLPELEYRVRLHLDGFAFRPSELVLKSGAAQQEQRVVATPTTQVHVKGVLRDLDGTPLVGETVVCRHWQGGAQFTATTDDEGRFLMDSAAAAGERTLLYLSESKFAVEQSKTDGMYGGWDLRFRARFEFTVDPDQELDVRAVPAAMVAGRVLDTDGLPVRNQRVELQEAGSPNRSPEWMPMGYATTDRDGKFTFRGLNAPPCDLRVSPGNIGTAATAAFQLAAGEAITELEIRLPKPGVVRGAVVDVQGAPLRGARVWLRNYDLATGRQTDGSVYEVLTDRDGRYRFIDVEPGGHALQLLVGDEHPLALEGRPFEVEPGSDVVIDLRAK